MTKPKNYKFHDTVQFRNVIKRITDSAKYKGYDEEKMQPIIDELAQPPSLDYKGSVKLHGTNASIILHEDHTISFHSKTGLLGYLTPDEEFVLLSDNYEFAQTMYRRKESIYSLVQDAEFICDGLFGATQYPIKLSGEWCGPGIQKGVGISNLKKKGFFLFGMKVGEDDGPGWITPDEFTMLGEADSYIFNVWHFYEHRINIDFKQPAFSQNELVQLTQLIEKECPVSKQLLEDGFLKEDYDTLLGEGLVWIPCDPGYAKDSGNWFKTKGEKHSVSKVKSVAVVDPEKLNSIQDFVEYAVTLNRLEQGLEQIGLDQSKVGAFIGWVNKDINKEEGDVLESNNLSMKDVGKYLANKARDYYLGKLNEQAGL